MRFGSLWSTIGALSIALYLGGANANANAVQWGVAISAYQSEGQPRSGGRTWSVWDAFSHADDGAHIADRSNGDSACNLASLDQWVADVDVLAAMQIQHVRLSISWSRIFPLRDEWTPNAHGVHYYERVLGVLDARNMTPWVTMFHWDTPLDRQDVWLTQEGIDNFVRYALVLVDLFPTVQHWITINEPRTVMEQGYEQGVHAPGERNRTLAFVVGAHFIQAHRRAVRAIRSFHPDKRLSMALNVDFFGVDSADTRYDAHLWFADALLLDKLPATLVNEFPWLNDVVLDDSSERDESNTPAMDFFALNFYSGWDDGICPPPDDRLASRWLRPCPQGLPALLRVFGNRYADASALPAAWEVVVTETGVSTRPGDGADDNDTRGAHVRAITRVVDEQDGVSTLPTLWSCDKVFLWSYVDNFEWAAGFTERFGVLGLVDPLADDPASRQQRCYRDSVGAFTSASRVEALGVGRCPS